MSPTHDYILSNQSGASFRTDLNNALAAIQSNNSNSSSPSDTAAYQFWADTSANIFKIRNSSNNAWINLFTLAGGIDVDSASNFNEDVTFTGASANIIFDKSADDLIFNDNAKAVFGTSSDGLEIFHDGSNSIVNDNGTGQLQLQVGGSTKFNTQTGGVQFYGSIFADDSNKIELGNDQDLQIFHDGSDSIINDNGTGSLRIQSGGTNQWEFNGSNLKGNDDRKIILGDSSDLQLFHNGSDSFIEIPSGSVGNFTVDIKQNNCGMFVRTTSTSVSNLTLRKAAGSGNDGNDYLQCRSTGNDAKFLIEGDGDARNANNSFAGFSDIKLKENIVDASSQWDDIKAVKVRNFNFKESVGFGTNKHIGVIAQEIEAVSPSLVKEVIDRDPDTSADLGTTTKTVKYSILYMKAVKCLQEAMTKNRNIRN